MASSIQRQCLVSGLALLLCGCITTSEKEKKSSMHAAESLGQAQTLAIRRALETGPAGRGTNEWLRESVSVDASLASDAGSEGRQQGSSVVSMPLGVKLVWLAAGLGLLTGLGWFLRKQSAAVDAAWRAADRTIASSIDGIEARARESTNPEELNKLNAELARLEKQRGKLAAAKGGAK